MLGQVTTLLGGVTNASNLYLSKSRLNSRRRCVGVVRLFALVGFLYLAAQPASAAIAFDAASGAATANAGASTLSFSHTVGAAGTNRIMIVGVSLETTGTTQVNGVTYNGVGLTRIGFRELGLIRAEMWQLLAPATGTHTVTVTTAASVRFAAGAESFTGVDQTTPHGTFQSASGNGVTSSLTVIGGSTGELVVDVLGRDDPSNASVATGQTQRWNQKTNRASGASSTKPGATSVTMTWTVTGGANDWVLGAISLRPALAPSLVKLISFSAQALHGGKVLLKWETGEEVDNLGFNVYREQNGEMIRLTHQLIAGSALMAGPAVTLTAGRSYSWLDTAPAGENVRYWLEDVDLGGDVTRYGSITVEQPASSEDEPLAYQRAESPLLSSVGTDSGVTLSSTRPVERTSKVRKATMEALIQQTSLTAGRAAIKVSINREGWYRLSKQQLVNAGLDPNTNPEFLQLSADGREQPILITREKGGEFGIEFYGLGVDTTWTDSRVYWLVAGTQPGSRIKSAPAQGGLQPVTGGSFQYTVARQDRTVYFSALKNGDDDNFFGAVVSSTPVDQTLTSKNLDQSWGKEAAIEVSLQGVSLTPHQVRVAINGVALGDITFSSQERGAAKFTVSQASLSEGDNHVTLTSQLGGTDVSLVASIRVTYWHAYKVDDNALRFTADGREHVTIDGFKSGDVRVLDVTTTDAPQVLIGLVRQEESPENGYSVTVVAPGTGRRTLLAFSADGVKQAAGIRADQRSSLRQKGNGADLVIITTQSLASSVEPLRALRQSQGLRVAVVDVEDIYDEFSFGQKTPQSIKDFLSFARSNWSPVPRYVLLAGDATYDPRNYMQTGDNDLVPTKLVGTERNETASDDWFADFDGDGLAEMAVGRLPVRTATEAATVVGKIVGYDSQQGSSTSLLVNDRNDGYNFEQASQAVKSLLPAGSAVVQVDRVVMDDATAKAVIMDNLNRGPKIVNYIGHGSLGIWNGNLLTSTNAKTLQNRGQLSVYVMMTCMNGLYHDTVYDSLAEVLMKSEQGGAVAVWASSGLTGATGQAAMDQQLFKNLFGGKVTTIGEAVASAKAATGDGEVRRTWILFGDPSMRLR